MNTIYVSRSKDLIYAKGEMADLTRAFNWDETPIGTIARWPVPLITTVNLILDSSFPMFIWWGEQKIQFYNDAYLKILGKDDGSKHPLALGQKGDDCWQEIWPVIKPLLDGVMQTGDAVYLENQLIPIVRNGKLDNVYWTFSYSSIRGAQGKPEGILVVCTETTKANQQIQENERQLTRVLDHMAEGVGITDETGRIVYSNPMAHQILNTSSDLFPDRSSNSPEWFNTHLDGRAMSDSEHPTVIAMATRKPVFNFEFAIERPGNSKLYLIMNAAPIIDTKGQVTGSVGMFSDITERKKTEEALTAAKEAIEKQKQLYEAITSGTPDLMYIFDLEYKFIYANKAILEMWGKTADAAIGKGLRENGYEEWHAQMHEREIDHIKSTGESVRGEVSFAHATLGKRIYDYILTPVTNELGEVIAISGTTRDITDIRQAEIAIAESERRFRTMAEVSGILIAMADETGSAIYFNQAWSRLTGRSPEDLKAYGWLDLLHPDDKDRYLNIYLDAFKIKGPFHGDFRILNNKGNYTWLLADGASRHYEDGSFAGFISASVDITALKEDEQRKNDFISMVSHELKTPLTSLNGYIQIVLAKARKREDVFAINNIEKATRQIGKMTTLINGFLNVSRLESGQIHIEPSFFDMSELLREIKEEANAHITSHHVIFAEVEHILVNADRDKIAQVIDNLISNAVKYSPSNTNIQIRCISEAGKAMVSVADQGLGVSSEDLPRLFERYYRVNTQGHLSIAGFGIGLYLCWEILKRHNGTIWAESRLGQGSTFYFQLPVA
jgi:PAS domain S-box-containing protein